MPYIPAPGELSGVPDARRVEPKNRRRRWVDRRGRIFEWDYQHGTVKVYDRRGRHLAEYDPLTGARRSGPESDTTHGAMTGIVTHRLVGYDRASGYVAVEHDVPERFLELAKKLQKSVLTIPPPFCAIGSTLRRRRDWRRR